MSRDDTLLQTNVKREHKLKIKELAEKEGMSVATYLRRMIINHLKTMEGLF